MSDQAQTSYEQVSHLSKSLFKGHNLGIAPTLLLESLSGILHSWAVRRFNHGLNQVRGKRLQ